MSNSKDWRGVKPDGWEPPLTPDMDGAKLLRMARPLAHAYLRPGRVLMDGEDFDDLVGDAAEALIRAWKLWDAGRAEDSTEVGMYLWPKAIFLMIDLRGSRYGKAASIKRTGIRNTSSVDPYMWAHLADTVREPAAERAFDNAADAVTVGRLLELVPTRHRRVLTEVVGAERTLREVAAELGISQSRTYQLKAEAIKILRKEAGVTAEDMASVAKTASPPRSSQNAELPMHLAPYWGQRAYDPRRDSGFCERQSRKTPTIPWHNYGVNGCLACGQPAAFMAKPSAA